MKQIGELLKEKRIQNGISVEEASEDLDLETSILESMEAGNIRAFKDMYILKELIKDYAKYLGADVNYLMEEYNDFLFEHTSRISLEDIEKEFKNSSFEKKISSPYTMIPKPKKNYKKYFKYIFVILGIFLVLSLIFIYLRTPKNINHELKCSNMEVYNEFTK